MGAVKAKQMLSVKNRMKAQADSCSEEHMLDIVPKLQGGRRNEAWFRTFQWSTQQYSPTFQEA